MIRKEYIYKDVDGVQIGADVYYDESTSDKSIPIALYYHGGNFTVRTKEQMVKGYIEKLLELGFVVISANYRLCPTIKLFDGPVTDALDVYRWAQETLPNILKRDANLYVDGTRIVTFGHSCGGTLALLAANLPHPPCAILDVYGMKYLQDPRYHTRSPATANLPPINLAIVAEVWKQLPPPTSGPLPSGPNGPNLGDARVAWMFQALKDGTHIEQIVHDGNYERVDPAFLFSKIRFPPTYFIHGSADTSVSPEFSQRACEQLKGAGAESHLVIVDGAPHGFDAAALPGDEYFAIVSKGLEFLKAHIIY
ncbi:alpha/beta-hydrolase [Rhizodiscina lignyota]|uniref:Alpha/beta-hydrolase n=1 Tax=Rhizodiscina lignyota TaxID=1504668 RepID=A0A9P4IP20_9PEZI|nr:alpha/beta-hydrolase [Rhizodiscina lignyota]